MWTLAAAQLVSWGSLYYSFSLFVIPMQRELGWSKTELNGALSLGLLITGLSGLPVGAWIDRRGGRALMTLGSLSAAALLFAWSRVESLAAFYVIWALLGAVLASVLYDPAFAVLTRDFGPGFRKAILTLTLVAGFASTVFIPLTELLVEELGWRAALAALALCNLVPATLHALFLPGAGRKVRKSAPPAVQDAAAGLSPLRRAMGRATFWCLLASFAAAAATSSSVTFHLVPLLSERGVDAATIVSCIAVIGPMQVAGRLVLFGLGAKLGAEVLGSLNVLAIPLSLLALLLLPSSLAALVAFARY
ncbi:MAG: MFS transporter [Alphaproteobacteria bacterium]